MMNVRRYQHILRLYTRKMRPWTPISAIRHVKHKERLAICAIINHTFWRITKVILYSIVIVTGALLLRNAEIAVRRHMLVYGNGNYNDLQKELTWISRKQDTIPTASSKYTFISNQTMNRIYRLRGCLVTDNDAVPCSEIETNMSTGLIHTFSPHLENEVRSKFVDPLGEDALYVLSPALAVYNEQLHMFSRVMLDRLRYRYAKPQKFPQNQFLTNYIHHGVLDGGLRTLTSEILGLPTPIFPLDGDGAMDPRVFQYRGKLYLMVLVFTHVEDKLWKPYPVIWDLHTNRAHVPSVNLTYNEKMPMEKNWTPLVVNDTLYLVYNVDPLRVLKCDLGKDNSKCDFVHDDFKGDEKGFVFERRQHTLRGGTPFVLYEWPYYISLAHSVIISEREGVPFGRVRLYEANVVILRADLDFRVVYASNALQFHPEIFKNLSMVYYEGQIMVENDFVYPVSIIKENNDSLVIGAHIKDHVSVLLRMTGIKELVDKVKVRENITRDTVKPRAIQEFVKRKFPRPRRSL